MYIAKCKEPLNVKWSRTLPSDPTSITISKDCAGRYFVSLLCEFEPELLIGSDGNKYSNPRHTLKYQDKLADLQRKYAEKGLKTERRCALKLQDFTSMLKAIQTNDLQAMLEHANRTKKQLYKQIRPYRKMIVEQIAREELDVLVGTGYLEGVRWLQRVSWHLIRISLHDK